MKLPLFFQSIIGAILLSLVYSVCNYILGLSTANMYNEWNLLANFLVAFVLGYLIKNSNYYGLQLSLIVFVIYFIIGHFNILIEAWIFNVTDRAVTILEMLRGFLAVLIFTPFYIIILQKRTGKNIHYTYEKRTVTSWIKKIGLVDIIYFFFYALAGFTVQATIPNFMDFYGDKIPPFELIISVQFIRGIIFASIAILVLKTTNLQLPQKAILVGLVFSVLGAIAPLIPPNEHMPQYIRLAHGFEVGISNFLFGVIAGYILNQKRISKKI